MADTAMSGSGTTAVTIHAPDRGMAAALPRLLDRRGRAARAATPRRTRGPRSSGPRCSVERCLYTEQGWADAEDALRAAEALAHNDDERGAAACERGQLAYAATLLGVRDRADEARSALGRAAALLPPGAPGTRRCSTSGAA